MRSKSKWARILAEGRRLTLAGVDNLRDEGILSTLRKTVRVFSGNRPQNYREWMRTQLYTPQQLAAQRLEVFDHPVLFSLITPLFNTPEDYLRAMIESVIAQTYPHWELCMADGSDKSHESVGEICRQYALKDGRIKYRRLEKNLGIAGNSNECIKMSCGGGVPFPAGS